ncbi:MAG: LL-diaminopimelate aminotransferase [Gaiellales bacterium]|nr:LL-diaminopimelate aminotransferase [Gaiellales bacterium]
MRGSSRLDGVPEYLSTRLMRTMAEARARGIDVISLGIGDPDTPPPLDLRQEIGTQALHDRLHVYPTNHGIAALREAVAAHYRTRFGVELDPEREILPLLGAKEGLAHLCLAQLDPGDAALVADPGYPVYYGGPALAGGEAIGLPLRAENGFLPELDAIDEHVSRRANLLICGYPNNPTGAVADLSFFERLASWGAQRGVAICHDNAYAELTYDGIVAPSFLAAPGAREAGIEIYSLSKSLSMPGWRIAFAVGNAELIGRLRTLKTNIDSGMWLAEQHAAIRAVERVPSFTAELRELYGRRRDVLCDGLERLGLEHVRPRGALYAWVRVPDGGGSVAFAERLLERAAVVVGPGAAYGPSSDGYVRLSLTVPEERLSEALDRISRAL